MVIYATWVSSTEMADFDLPQTFQKLDIDSAEQLLYLVSQ